MQVMETNFPCRADFIRRLFELTANTAEPFPSAIYVYGHAGTGKTSIIKEFLRHQKLQQFCKTSYVNCVECYSTKILTKSILEELLSTKDRCDTLSEFVFLLKKKVLRTHGYIVSIDCAERLRDMECNLLPTLLRLQELTGLNICVIFISQLPLEKFHCKNGISELIVLHCPQYSKADTLKILSENYNKVMCIIKRQITERFMNDHLNLEKQITIIDQVSHDFFKNYLNVFLSVFYKACRDIPELKTISTSLFLSYLKPVLDGSIELTELSRLWRNIATPLKSALAKVYIRFDRGESNVLEQCQDDAMDQSIKKMALSFELPFYGKYLLIAAFLASYNSAKDDKRLFVKHHGKQRKRLQTVTAKAKVTEKMNFSLGPKSFSLDRLLAIFYAILDEKVGLTCNLLSQISTLVHLKLLGFVSGENNIMDGSARLQCTVGLEVALYIGKIVGFNVYQYLCDFM